MTSYERMDPEGRCVSPDGHDLTDVMAFGSLIPTRVICHRCGKAGTIVVFDDEERQ